MKLISWNVNGLRACMGKGFLEFFKEVDADMFCIQETKMQPGQLELELEGYHQYWCSAQKKGYSGTALFCKQEPISVQYELPQEIHASEGRVIAAEFERFYLVNVYTPNSRRGLTRLDYRMEWEDAFLTYIRQLEEKKPVIICGDMNVAHREIDLKNPKTNVGNAGFTTQEREKMTALQQAGYLDSFRYFYPDLTGAYSWWSYMFHARENNAGWRIDYFLVSQKLESFMKDAKIHNEVMGSDHCPVELTMEW